MATTSDARPRHYRPRTKPSVGFRWWRASRYVVADGVIRPVGRVEPFYVAPGEIRWKELAAWGRGPLRAQDQRALLGWCQAFGLPGYALATTATIALPITLTFTSPDDAPAWETWPTYVRSGATWVSTPTSYPWDEETRPDAAGWMKRAPLPLHDPIYDPAEYGAPTVPLARLQPCLICPADQCPLPGTADFWQVYQEPVADIRWAGHVVQEVLADYERSKTHLTEAPLVAHLLHHNGWVVTPEGTPAWTGSSLLATLALSLVLQGKPLKACRARCGGLVPPGRSDQAYCTTRCAERMRKRHSRRRQRARISGRREG